MIKLTIEEKTNLIDMMIESLTVTKLHLESQLESQDINYIQFFNNQILYIQEKIEFLRMNAVTLLEK